MRSYLFFAVLLLILFCPNASAERDLPLDHIKLPPGFKIEFYAENVPNARAMTLGDQGTLFVGSRGAGRVYAIKDDDGDQKADRIKAIAEGLVMPSGVRFYKGDLYVGEVGRVIRFKDIENHLNETVEAEVVSDAFPEDTHHGWKFIAFGPDEKLYVPVGAPCNICEPPTQWHSRIWRMNPDGSELEVFAEGMRNTVGFDWDPQTGEMWFTENGRDWLGDDLPPDELNHAPRPGMHFGYPYCHGKAVRDPEFGAKFPCSDFTPAAQELGPHVASLGMRFYDGHMFPEEYRNRIFIAEHGSWNRSRPIGYRITQVTLKDNAPAAYEVFAEGWLSEEGPWGRPADVLVMPDGALLVADDHAGAIYRISWSGA